MSSLTAPASASAPIRVGVPAGRIVGMLFHWLGVFLFAAALMYLPVYYLGSDKYWLPLFSRWMALALFAMSVDLVWGYTGLLSLGQGLYFGLGVYAVGYSLKLQEAATAADLPFEVSEDMALPNFMEYCRLPAVPPYIAPLIDINLAVAVAIVLPILVATVFGMIVFRPQLKPVGYFVVSQASMLFLNTLGIFLFAPLDFQGAFEAALLIRLIAAPLELSPITRPIKGVYLSLLLQPILLGLYLVYIDAVTGFGMMTLMILLPVCVTAMFYLVDAQQRIKGVYFSLVTQALVLAVFTFVVNQQPYTGGVVGMTNLPRLQIFGMMFEKVSMYLLISGVLAVCFVLCTLLMKTKFGKVLTAIRDNEYRVLAMGYDTGMYKTFMFALAGGMAGLAGALYVSALRTCGPDAFGIAFSIEIVIMVAVGGRGTLAGAILGAVLVNFANTYITGVPRLQPYWLIILGSLFIGVVLFLPDGILGLLRKIATTVGRLVTSRTQPIA